MKKKIRTFLREAFDNYFDIKENNDDHDLNEDFLKGCLYGIRITLVVFNRVFEVSKKEVERSKHEAEGDKDITKKYYRIISRICL